MKHPSRWPWILRAPVCGLAILAVWWGPLGTVFYALAAGHALTNVESGAAFLLGGAILIGWSAFIMKTVVHRHIEPFFNIRSQQNPHPELFQPEPVHSFRDWLRLMFIGK